MLRINNKSRRFLDAAFAELYSYIQHEHVKLLFG